MSAAGSPLASLVIKFLADAQPFLDGVEGMKGGLDSMVTSVESLSEPLLAFASGVGIATSGVELLKSALEDFAETQKAEISLTALTGDAAGAASAIESLRSMALSEGLDFPSLVTADQRLVAFGVSAGQIPPLLQAAADAAAALNRDVGSVSDSIDRIALSGNAGGKVLATLGLSLNDLATSLGTTSDQAAKAFKALDESSRINVLTDALNKYAGVAQQAGEGLAGTWQDTKTQVSADLEAIGAALAPLASDTLNFVTAMAAGIGKLIDGITTLGGLVPSDGSTLNKILTFISSAAAPGLALVSALSSSLTSSPSSAPISTQIQQALGGTKGDGGQETSTIALPEVIAGQPTAETLKELTAALTAAKTAYADTVTEFKNGQSSADDVNASYAAMAAAAIAAGKPLKDLGTDTAALAVSLQTLGIKPVQDQLAGLTSAYDVVELAFANGDIGLTTYNAALNKFNSDMQALNPTLKEASAAFEQAKNDYTGIAAAFREGKSDQDAVNAAFAAMQDAAVKAGKPLVDLTVSSAALSEALKTIGVKPVGDDLNILNGMMNLVTTSFDQGGLSLNNYTAAVFKFASQAKTFEDQEKASDALAAWLSTMHDRLEAGAESVQQYDSDVKTFSASMDSLAGKFQAATGPVDNITGVLKSFGDNNAAQRITVDNLTSSVKTLTDLAANGYPGALAASQRAAEALDLAQAGLKAGIDLTTPSLSQLGQATTDAKTKYAAMTQAVDANGNSLYGQNQLIQQNIIALQDQITQQSALGKNTADLQVKLGQLTAALQPQATLWSTIETATKSAGDALKTGMGTAIDSLIAGTASLGDAFKTLGLQIVDIFVNQIIKLGVQELFNALANLGDPNGPMASFGKALGGIATQIGGIASSAAGIATNLGSAVQDIGQAGTGAIGDVVGTGDTLASIGEAGSSAASAASSVGSAGTGLTGAITSSITSSISGVVGAIGSIATAIGTFVEGSAENDKLFDIKVTLAGISNILFQLQQDTLQPMFDIVNESLLWMQGPIHEDLVSIWGELQDGVEPILTGIANTLTSMASAKATPGTMSITFNVYDASDPATFAQEVATYLKTLVPA